MKRIYFLFFISLLLKVSSYAMEFSEQHLNSLKISRGKPKSELSIMDHCWQRDVGRKQPDELTNYEAVSFFAPKKEIEIVEMNEAKIIKPNNTFGKTSLVTLGVMQCVAITAYNKANGYLGLIHIPGRSTDGSSAPKSLRVEEKFLSQIVLKFLGEVTDHSQKSDVTLHLFGGDDHKILIVKLVNIIRNFQYNIADKNIHHGRELTAVERKEKPWERGYGFNIELSSDGNVFSLTPLKLVEWEKMFVEGRGEQAIIECMGGSKISPKIPQALLSDSLIYGRIPLFLKQTHHERCSANPSKFYFKILGSDKNAPATYLTEKSEEIAQDDYTRYLPIMEELFYIQELTSAPVGSLLNLTKLRSEILEKLKEEEKKDFLESSVVKSFLENC